MSEQKKARDFAELITDLRGGNTHHELSLALQEATEAAKRTGKTASVTLQVKIKPSGDRQCEVTDTITKKIPEPARLPTVMFIDDEDNLSRSGRRQMKLDELKQVEQPENKLVDLGEKASEIVTVVQ